MGFIDGVYFACYEGICRKFGESLSSWLGIVGFSVMSWFYCCGQEGVRQYI